MQASVLTSQDQVWLSYHALACRLGCDFMFHDMFRPGSADAEGAASLVPIWYKGGFVPAYEVLQQMQGDLCSTLIFEQWEYWRYEAVQSAPAVQKRH